LGPSAVLRLPPLISLPSGIQNSPTLPINPSPLSLTTRHSPQSLSHSLPTSTFHQPLTTLHSPFITRHCHSHCFPSTAHFYHSLLYHSPRALTDSRLAESADRRGAPSFKCRCTEGAAVGTPCSSLLHLVIESVKIAGEDDDTRDA
jgi:hypothetical protein